MSVFRRDDDKKHEPQGPVIECACGCGTKLKQFDHWNRERKYLPGHHIKELWAKARRA